MSAPYVVERKKSEEAGWCPIAHCQSLDYARMIAAAGVARRLAVSYRAVDAQTGSETVFANEPGATAAT